MSRPAVRLEIPVFSAFACSAILLLGCASAPDAPVRATAARAQAASAAELAEARALGEGRLAWCSYLQELYRRGQGDANWPGFDACMRTATTGSAEVAKVAAECSMRVLDGFGGSPFSEEYANRAGLCGSEAIERSSADARDVDRLALAICVHADACGAAPPACRLRVETAMGPQLTRVVGALNRPARRELARCITRTSCGEIADDVTGCLEPLMDRLLYSSGVEASDPATPVAKR